MAQVCIDKGFKKACVITDINEAFMSWGKRFKEKFEALGGQVPSLELVDIKNTADFHSVMTSFRAKNPDKIQGSLVQAMNYTYYRKYPERDKRGVFTAFHKQYMGTYKEEYAQPATSIYDPALMFARAMEI